MGAVSYKMGTSLMVVDYFYLPGPLDSPGETDSPLVVDSYAELPCPVASQHFQSEGWRNSQIQQVISRYDPLKLHSSSSSDVRRNPT